jgi:hypothetical protein
MGAQYVSFRPVRESASVTCHTGAHVATNVLRYVIPAKNKSSRPRRARNVDKQNKRHIISFLDRQALVAALADQSAYL